MPKLSQRQQDLLRALPPYKRVRWGSGYIERKLVIGEQSFMPSTFNSLVDLELVWGIDHGYGRISAGRLSTVEHYLGTNAEPSTAPQPK